MLQRDQQRRVPAHRRRRKANKAFNPLLSATRTIPRRGRERMSNDMVYLMRERHGAKQTERRRIAQGRHRAAAPILCRADGAALSRNDGDLEPGRAAARPSLAKKRARGWRPAFIGSAASLHAAADAAAAIQREAG